MGSNWPFGGVMTPPPQALRPVNALQPRHTVPFNIYIPYRQTSGISMSGSMGVGLSVSSLGNRQLSLGVPSVQINTSLLQQPIKLAAASTTFRTPPLLVPSATAIPPELSPAPETAPAAGIGLGTIAIGAAALYFLTR